jgi:putative MATE family efflux protein
MFRTALTAAEQRIMARPLAPALARFGLPLALGMGLQTSFNLVDVYILSGLGGHAGSVALGAIAIADLIAAIGAILSYGLSVATGALLSRKQGEGDRDGVQRVAWQSVLLVLGVSALFSVACGLGARVLMVDVAGTKGEVAQLGTQFLRVMSLGSVTIFMMLHVLTIQRALGSSRTPIALLVAGNVLNFVLAVLFVYGSGPAPSPFGWGPALSASLGIPRLGLTGAAWATVIARLVVLLPMFYVCQKRFDLFGRSARTRPDAALMWQIVRIGWPTSSQLVLRVLAVFMVVALAQRLYTSEEDQTLSTALGLVFRLETMALYVSLGWGSAAQTFVGQNLGANHLQRAKQSGWYAALYDALMMAGFAGLCVAFGEHFIRFFDETPEVVRHGTHYLHIVAPSYVALGVGIVLGSAVQGAGATRITLLLDAIVVFGVQLPLCFAVYLLRLSEDYLWGAVAVTYVLFAIAYTVYYPRGRFMHQKLD